MTSEWFSFLRVTVNHIFDSRQLQHLLINDQLSKKKIESHTCIDLPFVI